MMSVIHIAETMSVIHIAAMTVVSLASWPSLVWYSLSFLLNLIWYTFHLFFITMFMSLKLMECAMLDPQGQSYAFLRRVTVGILQFYRFLCNVIIACGMVAISFYEIGSAMSRFTSNATVSIGTITLRSMAECGINNFVCTILHWIYNFVLAILHYFRDGATSFCYVLRMVYYSSIRFGLSIIISFPRFIQNLSLWIGNIVNILWNVENWIYRFYPVLRAITLIYFVVGFFVVLYTVTYADLESMTMNFTYFKDEVEKLLAYFTDEVDEDGVTVVKYWKDYY